VRLISGEAFGKCVQMHTKVALHYLDVRLEPNAKLEVPIPATFNTFVHVMDGRPTVAGHVAQTYETVLLSPGGESVDLANTSSEPVHVLVLSGDPLEGQEVYRNGPFVSNTARGARQAATDFYSRKNGFENIDHMFQ
jgi:quercetin 2,3-dioxygenase